MRNSVVLPAPLGPTRPTFSPGFNWYEASTKISCLPYCLFMFEKEIIETPKLAEPGKFPLAACRNSLQSTDTNACGTMQNQMLSRRVMLLAPLAEVVAPAPAAS